MVVWYNKGDMNIMDGYWFGMILGLGLGVLIMAFILGGSYKKGQIDAINGKIYYELVKQSNNTIKWEKIEK